MPQLLRSRITCTPSSSQRGETGCRAPALQQAGPPLPAPNSLRPCPALAVLGMERAPRLCCSRDRHLAPPNQSRHPVRTQPHAPGEKRLTTPALQPGDNIHEDLSNTQRLQCRRGQGGTCGPSVGSAPCPGSTVSPPLHLGMAWLWPLVLLGSIKPFAVAGLANTPMPPTNKLAARHMCCEEGDPSTGRGWKQPAFGSGTRLSRGANALARSASPAPGATSTARLGRDKARRRQGAASAPGPLPGPRRGEGALPGAGQGRKCSPPLPEGTNGLERG